MKYANEILQIHTYHLATPRAVTNAKNEKLWQWEGDAFGDVQPQVEHVKMPLRFAGQYADDKKLSQDKRLKKITNLLTNFYGYSILNKNNYYQ